jgi:hypothetical protein
MKNYLYYLLFAFSITSQSQSILVLDSLNHKPISFVNIKINKNSGTYTNENGYFEINKDSKDTLVLSHISYDNYQVKVSEIKDTIIMTPNAILLKEVKIANGKQQVKFIDFPNKNSNFGSWPVSSMSEIVSLIIPNKENEYSNIKKLEFSLVKRKFKELPGNFSTAFRVNIYSSINGEIGDKIYSSSVIMINPFINKKIHIDLNTENIEFDKNGIFIGLEVIGDVDEKGNLTTKKTSIRPSLSSNKIDDYVNTTYLKYTFDKKQKLIPLNDILKDNVNSQLKRSLSFGMTISK